MQLRNKKILLTGATGGIGHAIAIALAAQGAGLVLAGRNQTKLQTLANALASAAAPGDNVRHVTVSLALGTEQADAQMVAIAQCHPDIDIVVNCAGSNLFSACDQTRAEQTRSLIDINLTGTLLLTQALLPNLLTRNEGMIVNIGSTFGSIGYPGFAVYCASKFGLRGYTEALRRELANSRVKVVYVAPRATATDMNAASVVEMNKALGNAMDTPELVADYVIKSMQNERVRLSIGWPEKLFVVLNSLFTRLVDNALKKQLPVIQRFLAQEAKP
jgi:short-subunit dehydrogenase